MTRRRGTFRDPTGCRALPEVFRGRLQVILATLSEREAGIIRLRFGLTDGQPRTLNEIGQVYGLTGERVRQIEVRALAKLRRGDRIYGLGDFVGEDFRPDPEQLETSFLGRRVKVFCDRHGWSPDLGLRGSSRTCELCPCFLLEDWTGGRPSRYCSNACRQAAYRRRKKSEQKNRQRRQPKKPGG